MPDRDVVETEIATADRETLGVVGRSRGRSEGSNPIPLTRELVAKYLELRNGGKSLIEAAHATTLGTGGPDSPKLSISLSQAKMIEARCAKRHDELDEASR
jgi:hypothetical protein